MYKVKQNQNFCLGSATLHNFKTLLMPFVTIICCIFAIGHNVQDILLYVNFLQSSLSLIDFDKVMLQLTPQTRELDLLFFFLFRWSLFHQTLMTIMLQIFVLLFNKIRDVLNLIMHWIFGLITLHLIYFTYSRE